MPLQLWLPLNGNVKNKALTKSTYTSFSLLHDNSFFINQKFIRCNILNMPTSSTNTFGIYNEMSNLRNIIEV